MPIFDTHAHYDSGAFNADRDAVLAALPAAGVTLVVNPGCDLESSRQAVALAERFPHVYAAVGIHPSDCGGCGETEFEELKALCRHEKVVAIGEIGLDYYWQDNPPREFQQMVFRRQIELALSLIHISEPAAAGPKGPSPEPGPHPRPGGRLSGRFPGRGAAPGPSKGC